MLEESWESALQQLRRMEAFVKESNPGRQQSIINGEGGRNSYLMELHGDFARCYEKLGNPSEASKHRDAANALWEVRERTWTRQDMENEGQVNLIAAIQYALQTSGADGGLEAPLGWMNQAWVREPVEDEGGPVAQEGENGHLERSEDQP